MIQYYNILHIYGNHFENGNTQVRINGVRVDQVMQFYGPQHIAVVLPGNKSFSGVVTVTTSQGTATSLQVYKLPIYRTAQQMGYVYYLHDDQLGTPEVMSDSDGSLVWRATARPFGKASVNEDLDGDGNTVTLNLRQPGQYYDEETGLHYNYFRYYDPSTGRYITADPLGINGLMDVLGDEFTGQDAGLYTYSKNNPLNNIDPFGLTTYSFGFGGSFQAGGAGGSASGSFGFDTSGQICVQFTTCGRIGPGASAGAGLSGSVGEGNFCEGNSTSAGIFVEGGGGIFSGASGDAGTSGSSGTVNIKGGIGGGASGGAQACITRTKCF